MRKPKLKDFILPVSMDFTGEKSYSIYRKAKNEWIAYKKTKLIDKQFYWINIFNEWTTAQFIELSAFRGGGFLLPGYEQEFSTDDPLIAEIKRKPIKID